MKKALFLSLPMISVLGLLAFQKEKSIILKLNLKKGATYSYIIKANQNTSVHIGEQSHNSTSNTETDMSWKVMNRYGNDSILLSARYTNILMAMSNNSENGQNLSLNLYNSNSNKDRLAGIFTALKANLFIVKLNSSGEVLGVRGFKEFSSAVEDSINNDAPDMKNLLGELLDINSVKQNFNYWGILPRRPVSVGDSWSRAFPLNNVLAMVMRSTYTVKEIRLRDILINVSSKIFNTKDSASFNGFIVPIQISGTGSGTYVLDRTTGLLTTGKEIDNTRIMMHVMGRDISTNVSQTSFISEKPIQ